MTIVSVISTCAIRLTVIVVIATCAIRLTVVTVARATLRTASAKGASWMSGGLRDSCTGTTNFRGGVLAKVASGLVGEGAVTAVVAAVAVSGLLWNSFVLFALVVGRIVIAFTHLVLLVTALCWPATL